MSASVAAGVGRPTLRIGRAAYPVVLPTVRDPRLHLAAVIISLQVLGQTAFDFQLSIAQILIALATSAGLEIAITFWRQQVIMWPASALLTGNGVAFILRVPGTAHGDWWSTHGWWIFAGTAAVGLLSKYVIRLRGRHVFNPANIGLVLCFLALGASRAEPLDFWWGPMSVWLALALGIIVAGGLAILGRLRLLEIAVWFWLAFAAGLAVLAASEHAMTAHWHLGPVADFHFWRILVFSPEVLVFLFFMITDPRTVPQGRAARRAYAVGIGLLATLLIAPLTTEYASKVALLGALALACAVRPLLEWVFPDATVARLSLGPRRAGALALGGAAGITGLILLVGSPARTDPEPATAAIGSAGLPSVSIVQSDEVAAELDRTTGLQIAGDLVADLESAARALRERDTALAEAGAGGEWLEDLRAQIADGPSVEVSEYDVDRVRLTLEPGEGQGPPLVVATATGSVTVSRYDGAPVELVTRQDAAAFTKTFELLLTGDRFLIVGVRGAEPVATPSTSTEGLGTTGYIGPGLKPVAATVAPRFTQDAFHSAASRADPVAMMGGGVCWLDFDSDGRLDLFAVNSYAVSDVARWKREGGLPRSALFRNANGRFVDVSRHSGADLELRGNGCVAADFDLDGHADLYVTSATYDALLWNRGDGTFVEGARSAGIDDYGWHTGAAVGDVNRDGRPDLYVAGYTNLNAPAPESLGTFPSNFQGFRDLLYLNEGPGANGRPRFREVGLQAGLDTGTFDHSLGAVFSDLDGDGRLDLYVANDLDPNRLYRNTPWPGGRTADPAGLGFRFVDRAAGAGVADAHAGMGVAAADFDGDGRSDLVVTNSREQGHAVYRGGRGTGFADVRDVLGSVGRLSTGWGASLADLDLDADLDLIFAAGAIPVTDLVQDAEPIQVFDGLGAQRRPGRFAYAIRAGTAKPRLRTNGRGLATADFDNDGDLDVAVNNIGGPLVLVENTTRTGHWLEVDMGGFHPGAVVTAVLPNGRKLVREVRAGGSYLSSEDPRVHFGLGNARRVEKLVIRYPSGRVVRLEALRVNRIVRP